MDQNQGPRTKSPGPRTNLFHENREFNNEDILASIQTLMPLARTKNKEIDLLKAWSESGNVISASKYH